MLNKICLAVKQRARTFFSSMPTSGAVSSINTPINSQPRWCHLRIPVVSSGSLLHKRPALYHVTHANYHCCLAATSHSQATCQDQEAAQRFTHSLSEEQAAAALAGDGHLRYNQAPAIGTQEQVIDIAHHMMFSLLLLCSSWPRVSLSWPVQCAANVYMQCVC